MKLRKILLLLIFNILLLCALSACSEKVEQEEIEIYSYDTLEEEEVVIENDKLEFHFDPVTTQFYVVMKSTGDIWYSNPQDIDTDTIAAGINKKDLSATISLKYNTKSGSPTSMNNFGSSIEKGNFNYELLEKGVKVNYTIGDLEKVYLLPAAVPESRFNEFFLQLDKSAQNQILMSYRIYDINKLKEEDNKDELLATYPDLATEKVYVIREGVQEYLKQKAEDAFATVGYNQEEYDKDAGRYSSTSSSDKPIFNVSIEYKLEEDGLLVSIPLEEIEYKTDYPITEIRPLGYFGAGNSTAEGFMFVPDGSGAIINFNNNKQSQNPYSSNVYGWDYGINRDAVIDETKATMPIFGISNKTASFICVLEEGSSYGFIEADVSGRMHSYNYAAANYYLIHNELMDISAKSDTTVRMFQEQLPKEVISQRYIFIEDTDYTAMATSYREYMQDIYPELTKLTESDLPVAVEIIGAVDRTKHVLGVPTRQPDALTTYEETVDIVDQLLSFGISDLRVKLNGWFNSGVLHDAPNKVSLISELGSKKDFKKLVSHLGENDVKLYLQATFQFLNNNSTFDNFLAIRDSAKHVNRELVELYPYHPVWYGEDQYRQMYYLAKPSYYLSNLDSYAKDIADLGVTNLAFGDIGNILSADYDEKKELSREAVLKLQTQKLSQLNSDGFGMMLESGNIYAVPYADMIVDLNLATKGYNLIDEEVPFYEIVIHGLIPYTGDAVNLASDYERHLLKTAETGAGLYFIFMEADSFELQESNYTKYFSSEFAEWSEITKELYHRMKKDFGHLYNQYIVGHQKLEEGVYRTEYEDGTRVIVNYNENAYTYNQTEVPAKDYIVEGGKQ
jgi:hypothetical protein